MPSHVSRVVVAVLVLLGVGCDKAQLLAPTDSTVAVSAASQFVPLGGSTQVTAYVLESAGTPVNNGTTVHFTTNLGRMEPTEAQTTNGYATTTFVAGSESGVADVRATSGGAVGAGGDTAGSSAGSLVQITVGAAAVESVILGANPSSVPAAGGSVTLLATVSGAGGLLLSNIPVTFVTSAGQLGASVVTTDANGQARTTLTTAQSAMVTATAGTKTSETVSVTAASVVTATVSAVAEAVVSGVGQRWTFTANVVGAANAAQALAFDWDFGDSQTITTNGNTTAHVYGPATENTARIVRVSIALSDSQTIVAATEILIGDIVP